MTPALDLLSRQLSLAEQFKQNIATLHKQYREQIQLTLQVLIDAKLSKMQYGDEDCHAVDEHDIKKILEKLENVTNLVDLHTILQDCRDHIRPSRHESNCEQQWLHFQHFFEKQLEFLGRSLDSSDILGDGIDEDLSLRDKDVKLAYQRIIDPLSNQKRLDILMVIAGGKRRFKDLEEALELKAGHLIYHLNPLKEAEFVQQDKNKNYHLSTKGTMILSLLKKMYIQFDQFEDLPPTT